MAIEAKDLLTYLGIPESVADIDTFKTEFTKKYDTMDNFFVSDAYKQKKSEINGMFVNRLSKEAKSNGVDITDDFLKDENGKLKDNEQIIKDIFAKVNENQKGAIEKVKGEYSKNKDKGAQEWEEKYNLLNTKVKDLENVNLNQKNEFEKEKNQFGTQVKQIKLQTIKEQLVGGVKYKTKITPLEKAGFVALIEAKYNIDLDDKGERFITDKNGARIPNPTTHGTFKTPEEVYKEEAIANNVYELNPSGGAPANSGATGINSFFEKRQHQPIDVSKEQVLADRAQNAVSN